MSSTKAIPGLAVGDTVWLHSGIRATPARVLRVYETMGKALAVRLGGQTHERAIFGWNESADWWRTEAAALVALRERRRSRHVRNREAALRGLVAIDKERAETARRLDESEARVRAELAEIDAALAALDGE